jgi:hypothetical protein
MWRVLLADGTRALLQAGRWRDTIHHIKNHNGMGRRLLDGRQAVIIARSELGHTHAALALLDAASTDEPWETAIASCLRVLCLRRGGHHVPSASTQMVLDYLNRADAGDSVVFDTRLGLSVAQLAATATQQDDVVEHVARTVLGVRDATVAADLLAYAPAQSVLTSAEIRTLETTIEESGVHIGALPEHLLHDLLTAVDSISDQLAVLLQAQSSKSAEG